MRGEIDFRESLTPACCIARRTGRRRRCSASTTSVCACRPAPNACLPGSRRVGAKTLLVSGGFTFFTDRLKARLGLDHTLSNTLEIRDGKLTGRIEGSIVDAEAKAAELARLARNVSRSR